MPLKLWYKIVTPRQDLREGKPINAFKFATGENLKINLKFEAKPEGGISSQKIEETKFHLRELGLQDNINVKKESDG